MNFDLKEIATITMILFAVIDVIGSLPVLIDVKAKIGKIESEKATLVSGAIMIAPETSVAFSDSIFPIFAFTSMRTGNEPITSITANKIMVMVAISFRSKFME